MEPRVSKRERKLHLSYDVPRRIHCASIYPKAAPNGSTLILYGHDRGLQLLWRGGRRLREQTLSGNTRKPNGSSRSQDAMPIDGEDHDNEQQGALEDLYELEEDEQNPDSPFPSVIQIVDLGLETEVLHMAVPSFSTSTSLRGLRMANSHAFVALACSNGKILLLTIPLAPPTSAAMQSFTDNDIGELQFDINGAVAHDISVQLFMNDDTQASQSRHQEASTKSNSDARILVAAAVKRLHIWDVILSEDSASQPKELSCPILPSPLYRSTVSFQPSSSSSRLLFTDQLGAIRVYDISGVTTPNERPGSRGAVASFPNHDPKVRLAVTFLTPFQTEIKHPALQRRKKLLDAKWVLSGRGILALLEDGEWGIWDVTGSLQPGKSVGDFSVHGFLGSSNIAETAEPSKQKKNASKLAPMTPNTRKAKAENLFSGASKAPGAASTGGISVTTSSSRAGAIDESVVMWYNDAVYTIPSFQTFWQRSTNNSGGFGSLYAPGLIHIPDIDLMNENITSIAQFAPSRSAASNFGQIITQRDLLISAEHRFIVLQNLRPQLPPASLFQQQIAERPASRDQRMLDAGELDLGGMDRMLESMTGDARARKVGFAH